MRTRRLSADDPLPIFGSAATNRHEENGPTGRSTSAGNMSTLEPGQVADAAQG